MGIKISVLMGVYNCSETLQQALDSLYNQTYQLFKIILCDDGSTDETLTVAEENQKKHDNIIILRNSRNMGLNYTLNRCLDCADTEYCARMDGDDVCEPTRFEKQVEYLEAHPELSFCSCKMYMFDDKGIWGETLCLESPTKKEVLKYSPCFNHAAAMIKTSVYKDVGGYSVSDYLLRVEDCHLWFKFYAKGYLGGNLLEPLYGMRDDRSATKRRTWIARRNAIYVMCCGYKMLDVPWYQYYRLIKIAVEEMAKFIMPDWMYNYFHRHRQRIDA